MKIYSLSIDFGGTEVKMGIFREKELMESISYSTETNMRFEDVLKKAKRMAETLLLKNHISWEQIKGIGIAMPGIVNFHEKKVISINDKYNGAIDFNIEQWFMNELSIPVIIENDANAALLGERRIGSLGDAKYAALMILGTGVGTATIINGELFRGAHNQGGCLGGHLIIDYKGRACNCGSIGCLEAQASTWALAEIVKLRQGYHESSLAGEKKLKIEQLVAHAKAGDLFSNKILYEFIEKWSAGVINLIHAYDPEVVVISGGILQAGEIITKPLIERVQKFTWAPYGKINIKISNHLKESVLYGMSYLVDENIKETKDKNE